MLLTRSPPSYAKIRYYFASSMRRCRSSTTALSACKRRNSGLAVRPLRGLRRVCPFWAALLRRGCSWTCWPVRQGVMENKRWTTRAVLGHYAPKGFDGPTWPRHPGPPLSLRDWGDPGAGWLRGGPVLGQSVSGPVQKWQSSSQPLLGGRMRRVALVWSVLIGGSFGWAFRLVGSLRNVWTEW